MEEVEEVQVEVEVCPQEEEEECSPMCDLQEVRLKVIYCGSIREYARRNSHEIVDAPRARRTPRRRWIQVWTGPRPRGDVFLRYHVARGSAPSTPLIRNSAHAPGGMFVFTLLLSPR